MKKLSSIVLLLISFCSLGQSPTIEWEKRIGGEEPEVALSISQTTDGGYITAGYFQNSNNYGYDFWIVKTDPYGIMEWDKIFGGPYYNDMATSIQQTVDGGYIVAGNKGFGQWEGQSEFWIIKLDGQGNVEWEKVLGGFQNERAYSIVQNSDGGYIVVGSANSNNGDVSGNHGGSDYWAVRLDSFGNVLWQKCFGGSGNDHANDVKQTADGGFVIAGGSWSNDGDVTVNNGNYDYWIIKIDENANLEWQKSFGGSDYDEALSILQTTNGGYIIAGVSYSSDGDVNGNLGNSDYWVVKLNESGNLEWKKNYGGKQRDGVANVLQTADGGFILAGNSTFSENESYSTPLILKLDPSGNVEWEKWFPGSEFYSLHSINHTSDDGLIFAGSIRSEQSSYFIGYDFWIVKLGSYLSVEDVRQPQIFIYPNPVKNTLNFSEKVKDISVVDFSGNVLKTNDKITQELDISNLPKGIYLIKGLTEKGQKFSNKIVKN